MLAVWQAADDIDVFESGWTFDHFYPIFTDSTGPCLEGWTTLTALAQATKRLRLGMLVTGIHYRHPAVLANMAAALDIISNGRLELGIGAGWNEEESGAYGIELGTHQGTLRPVRGSVRGAHQPAEQGHHDIRRQVLPAQGRPQRAEGSAEAAPAHLHRRQRREAHAEDHGEVCPALELRRRHGRGVRPASATCSPRIAQTSAGIPRRSCCQHMFGSRTTATSTWKAASKRPRRWARRDSTSPSSTCRRRMTPAVLEPLAEAIQGFRAADQQI